MVNYPLEKRILDRIVFISILIIVLYALIQTVYIISERTTIINDENLFTFIILISYSSYYLMKVLRFNFEVVKIFIYLVFFGSVIGSFFNVNGFNGITAVDFLSLLITGIFLFPSLKGRIIIITINSIVILVLLYVQEYLPHTIRDTIIVNQQITLTIGIISRFLLGLNLAIVILQEYKHEQNKIHSKNQKIEILNIQLQQSNSDLKEINQSLINTIDELKATQEQLVQSEKMASLGTLTAGIAHEINNPLNYIMGAYIGLKNYFNSYGSEDEKKTSKMLNGIKEGIKRASNIVNGLNQFSRDNSRFDEDCEIHTILDNCLVILYYQLKHNISIVKKYYNKPIIVSGNVGKLHQVFTNILTNAIQAINNKGIIKIKTKINQEKVFIEILDNGCGIKEEHIKQITDPFFTTKSPGEGTGLGLSISYSIIKEHKGIIEFESEINKGTKVTIIIPNKA